MADAFYNGMPASDLPALHWRLAGGAPDAKEGAGVEMACCPTGRSRSGTPPTRRGRR